MNNNYRENDLRRAHILFLVINAVFSILLILRIIRPPVWEVWFIPVVLIIGVGIWVVYFKNAFSPKARTLIIAGASLVFLYFYGCHYEVFEFEFPLCMVFFTTACASLDEHSLTYGGVLGYFLAMIYHAVTLHDSSVIFNNYLSITVMLTVLFYSRFLVGRHSREIRSFDESLKRMEEERKSREDFLANVSHELRTPVNAIVGMTDILLKKDLDKEIREEILTIERAGIRLSSQIDDILDFSEIISASLTDESESYFFADFVKDLKNINVGIGEEDNKRIIWEIDSSIPSVLFGDRKKIRRVFTNIFSNALKKSEGNVYVNIHSRKEEYGINLSIAIRDEGQGIKQEDIDRAYYGRFEGSNQNNRQEGLKLGLSISNGLVRFMNGFMMFNSTPGEGTTVTITIPQKVMDEDYWKEGLDIDEEEDVLDLTGYRILVVDDDHMNLNVAKKMLSIYGGETKTVDSGLSALELCKSEKFDLIFMDHMMPGMDGIDTYRAIKSHPSSKNRDTVFIALTANAVSGARDMFLSEGFADFVSKPIDRKALEQAISKILRSIKHHTDASQRAEEEAINQESQAVEESVEIQETPEISESQETQETPEISESQETLESQETPEISESQEIPETPETTPEPVLPESPEGDKMQILAGAGVNTVDALSYCAGSEDFYFMMLADFEGQIEDKITELSGYMEANDEDNYRIKIHALKSNTKTLGFDELSEMSRLSEMACKEERFSEARDAHQGIMEKLREVKDLLNKIK